MREDGFYWVRPSYGLWSVAQCQNGKWSLAGMGGGFGESFFEQVGPRVYAPGSQVPEVAPEMAEAGYHALRNSSWHEMSPTELDIHLSAWRPIFEEVFIAMSAVQPQPEPAAWERRATPNHEWVSVLVDDLPHYRDNRGQDTRPLYAGEIVPGKP